MKFKRGNLHYMKKIIHEDFSNETSISEWSIILFIDRLFRATGSAIVQRTVTASAFP